MAAERAEATESTGSQRGTKKRSRFGGGAPRRARWDASPVKTSRTAIGRRFVFTGDAFHRPLAGFAGQPAELSRISVRLRCFVSLCEPVPSVPSVPSVVSYGTLNALNT